MARWKRWLAVAALVGTSACDELSCWWTDHPDDPWTSHEPNRRYRSDEGLFEIVLQPDGDWPPVVGSTSMRIEGRSVDPQPDAMPELMAERPHTFDGELVAEIDPVVGRLEPMLWRIEQVELDAPGRWVVPLLLEAGELDDAMDLRIEVEADE